MRARTRITWVALVLLAWGVGTPGPAGAATPATTVVVTTDLDRFAGLDYLHVTDSIVTAGTGALDWIATNAVGMHVTILVDGTDGAAYAGGFTIGENDDISIEGFPPQEPEQVIIEVQLAGDPVIRLSNVGESVTIEGVTLTGGDVGLHIEGTTGQIAPSVDRCYIRDNQGHGVEVTGNAAPMLRNLCVSDNGGDGIHVATTGFVAGGATTTIIHCTIRNNGGSGVLAMPDVGVSVQNTLVWQNGQVEAAPVLLHEFLVDDSAPSPLWDAMPQWEFGPPAGQGGELCGGPGRSDPGSAFTDSNVYGINLNGDYTHYPAPAAGEPILIGETRQFALDVPYPLTIRDVSVYFDITHPTVENLTLSLTSPPPGGQTVELLSGIGGQGDDFQDTILDDNADDPINDPAFEPPYADWFQAVNSLAPFDGQEAQGTWQLEVKNEATDCGLLNEPFDVPGPVPQWSGGWEADAAGYFHPGAAPGDDISFYNGPEATEWRDYRFQCRFRLPLSVAGDHEAAFIFRRQDDTHYYEFGYRWVAATGRRFFFAKQDGPTRTDTGFGPVVGSMLPRDVWYDITITVQGESMTLVTGNLPDTGIISDIFTDASFAEGGIGFRATQDTWFDDVCVTSLDEGVIDKWGLYIVPDEPRHLTTGPLDFSGQAAVELQFQQWLNTSASTTATLEVSLDGATWDVPPIWDTAGAEESANDWTPVTHDLSEYDDASSVFLRWGYDVAETALPCSGWNIDDIQFFGASPDVGGLVYTGVGNTDNLQVSANYVWDNSSLNYIGFYPDAQSIPDVPEGPVPPGFEDPSFAGIDWRGKLNLASPMIDRGVAAGVEYDFEREFRAATGTPDIGADEVGAGLFGGWIECQITPPVAGQLAAGELTVEVWVDGELDVADALDQPTPDPADRLFVLPQAVTLLDADYISPNFYVEAMSPVNFIRLAYEQRGLDGVSYIFTNMDPIATSVTSNMNEPVAGDWIADGHARVYMYVGGPGVIEQDMMSGQVVGDGVVGGRDFLIDTVPPLVEEVLGLDSVAALASPWPYGTLGVSFGGVTHPYVAPAETHPQANPGLLGLGSHATYWPYVEAAPGALVPGEDQVKLFYNVGSWANDYYDPLLYLDLAVIVLLRDQTVEEAFPDAAPIESRQVSGFLNDAAFSGTPVEVVDANPLVLGDQVPALWLEPDGVTSLSDSYIGMDLIVSPGVAGNVGDFADYEGSALVQAEWRFHDVRPERVDGLGDPLPGIPIDLPVVDPIAGQGRLHFSGTFGAVDRAGNGPVQLAAYSDYVESLGGAGIVEREVEVWWLLGTDVQLDVTKTEVVGIYPQISWNLPVSHLDIPINEAPAPVYAYRIWLCSEHGVAAKNEPYEPWLGWQDWSLDPEERAITPENFVAMESDLRDQAPPDSLKDRWLMVSAVAIDPAGNVGWWPGTKPGEAPGPILGLDGWVTVPPGEDQGDNWVRFYIPASEIDTTLSPTLFYVEPDGARTNLGAAPIVAYPTAPGRYILGMFDIGLIVPGLSAGEAYARVEVEEDGAPMKEENQEESFSPLILEPNAGANRVRLELPGPEAPDVVFGYPDRVVNYVVRVTAETDADRRDPSPAHFSFKVVPGTVAGYLEGAGADVGEQPVKQFESDVK